MLKSAAKAEGEAVSTEADPLSVSPKGRDGEAIATRGATAVTAAEDDQSGVVAFSLSRELRDNLSMELQEALHQIETGFGTLTAPGDVFKREQPFVVIDAGTIDDFVDQATGEEKVKHIFRLEMATGEVLNVMQSDARPRRTLAKAFTRARALGARLKCGPYKYEKKPITGQIQPAFIMVQQPGFRAEVY